MSIKTVAIIVGSARSGSTLLTKALGGHSKVLPLGEINRFNSEINSDKTHCGCANKLVDCSFWNEILVKLKNKTGSDIKGLNGNFSIGMFNELVSLKTIHYLIFTIFFKRPYKGKKVKDKIHNTFTLYNTLFNETNSSVLIDSSKGLFRALVLASRADKNVQFKFIQLTRDGRGHLNSKLKATYSMVDKEGVIKNYRGTVTNKNPSKIIASWLYMNLRNFIILKLLNNSTSVFVRYEDFTANPEQTLKKIFSKVSLEYEPTALNLDEHRNHILGGNASRVNAKRIKKQDDTWRKSLDEKLIKEFNRKAGWFNRLVGYR